MHSPLPQGRDAADTRQTVFGAWRFLDVISSLPVNFLVSPGDNGLISGKGQVCAPPPPPGWLCSSCFGASVFPKYAPAAYNKVAESISRFQGLGKGLDT